MTLVEYSCIFIVTKFPNISIVRRLRRQQKPEANVQGACRVNRSYRPETRKRESCGWSESSRSVNVFLLQTCICRKLLLSVQSSSAKVLLLEIWHAYCVHVFVILARTERKVRERHSSLIARWKNLFVFTTIVLRNSISKIFGQNHILIKTLFLVLFENFIKISY